MDSLILYNPSSTSMTWGHHVRTSCYFALGNIGLKRSSKTFSTRMKKMKSLV